MSLCFVIAINTPWIQERGAANATTRVNTEPTQIQNPSIANTFLLRFSSRCGVVRLGFVSRCAFGRLRLRLIGRLWFASRCSAGRFCVCSCAWSSCGCPPGERLVRLDKLVYSENSYSEPDLGNMTSYDTFFMCAQLQRWFFKIHRALQYPIRLECTL